MTEEFTLIRPEAVKDNPVKMIGSDWMLITAGKGLKQHDFNTMTAAWGSFGFLWQRPVATCFVRPTRYTYEFMEENEYFTLAVFTGEYRGALNICGTESGRDGDKVTKAGLTPFFVRENSIGFKEARLIVACKKIYFQDLDPSHFLDPGIEKNYPHKDYHRVYIGEITGVYVKE